MAGIVMSWFGVLVVISCFQVFLLCLYFTLPVTVIVCPALIRFTCCLFTFPSLYIYVPAFLFFVCQVIMFSTVVAVVPAFPVFPVFFSGVVLLFSGPYQFPWTWFFLLHPVGIVFMVVTSARLDIP